MNRERLLAVADAIEQESLGIKFDMANYVNPCGTAACIAGMAAALYYKEKGYKDLGAALVQLDKTDLAGGIRGAARRYLDLTEYEAGRLFVPELFYTPRFVNHNKVTATQAVKVLRRAAATGQIKWPKEDEEEPDL